MSKYKHQQAIREELDKELGGYKIDGKEFREMWGLFDLVLNFLDEQLSKKEEEVKNEILTDLILPKEGHTPDYILDHPDGRIRKAYEDLMMPMDLSGKTQTKK